jgi:hypothetical protein
MSPAYTLLTAIAVEIQKYGDSHVVKRVETESMERARCILTPGNFVLSESVDFKRSLGQPKCAG